MNGDMMNVSAEMMPGIMWGMGLMGLLVTIILILATAALIKYLFFDKQGGQHEENFDAKHGF